ncbi:DUF998 domain-containing protein [Nocardiopsis composta]|uniref:DUF998 domain-containing protein n=1 Tax=Nocardiopsis composta TaxID=157465 RepID=A0A7W8VDY3_9ACTN|nr:DUF998 domain-containing protein [Nocardiopsis composta]MBB5432503.1 hypothetical protein [Nocardiopsis composta]
MRRRTVFAAAAVLSGVLYSSFWLEGLLPTGTDPVAGYASELFARDRPLRPLFASTEVLAGAFALVAGAAGALALRHRPRSALAVLCWGGLLLFGAMTVVDALVFPMDCAPSTDAACARAEAAGRLSASHGMHEVASSTAVLGGLAAMAGSAGAARLGLRPVLLLLAAVQAAATALLLWLIASGGDVGIVQRIQISLFSVWLIVLGAAHDPDE